MEPEKKKSKKTVGKLYFMIICLVLAVVVLGGATYAWQTISTNPEIALITAKTSGDTAVKISTDNVEYSMSKALSIGDYAPLVPVSTVDGLNWFITTYDNSGNVIDQYSYLRFPDGANKGASEKIPVKSTLGNATKNVYSYYIYADLYLKTGNTETEVYLSMPSNIDTYEPAPGEGTHYGTYVLGYKYDEEDRTLYINNYGANTAVRVGIISLGELEQDEDGEYTIVPDEVEHPEYYFSTSGDSTSSETPLVSNDFYILEPNSDTRSANPNYMAKEVEKADIYVAGFSAKNYSLTEGSNELTYSDLDGYYFQTYPIKATDITLEAIDDLMLTGDETEAQKQQKIAALRVMYDAWTFNSQGITTLSGKTGSVNGRVSTFPVSDLITQKTSYWRSDITSITRITDVDSTYVGKMGKFIIPTVDLQYHNIPVSGAIALTDYNAVKFNTDDSDASVTSNTKITTLYKDVPQKVRIYFWIEGQDVDCWNDIAKTRFLANIEFLGKVIVD